MNSYGYDNALRKRLAQLRVQKGVSAREMSLALGQNTGYISNIESGKTLGKQQISALLSGRCKSRQSLIHASESSVHCIMFDSVQTFRRKDGRILLGSSQPDVYFIFGERFYVGFEYHFIGDVVCIRVAFV